MIIVNKYKRIKQKIVIVLKLIFKKKNKHNKEMNNKIIKVRLINNNINRVIKEILMMKMIKMKIKNRKFQNKKKQKKQMKMNS